MHTDWKKLHNPEHLVMALAANCLADAPLLSDITDVVTRAGELARKPLEEEVAQLKESYANSESRADYNQEERKRLIAKKDSLHKECAARTKEGRQLRQQLAAAQADSERLRSAILQFRNEPLLGRAHAIRGTAGYAAMQFAALDAPSDTSALENFVKQAGGVMRDRATNECDAQRFEPECPERATYCAEAIRALPEVNLNDLK